MFLQNKMTEFDTDRLVITNVVIFFFTAHNQKISADCCVHGNAVGSSLSIACLFWGAHHTFKYVIVYDFTKCDFITHFKDVYEAAQYKMFYFP